MCIMVGLSQHCHPRGAGPTEKLPKNWREAWHTEDFHPNDLKSTWIASARPDECAPLVFKVIFAVLSLKNEVKGLENGR